jgi:membrane protein implicated in regulation of membrane protease activity
MMPGRSRRSFAIYSLVVTIVEDAILVIVLLVVLPLFGISLPVWLVVVLPLAWAAWSYFAYRMGKKVIGKTSVAGAEALVGARCVTSTPLSPVGYIRVGNELWRAHSISGHIDAEVEVVVAEVKGLTLYVRRSSDANSKDKPTTVPESGICHD